MATTMQLTRAWTGLALFSYGFRPFFLGAAVLAALLVGAWVPWLSASSRCRAPCLRSPGISTNCSSASCRRSWPVSC